MLLLRILCEIAFHFVQQLMGFSPQHGTQDDVNVLCWKKINRQSQAGRSLITFGMKIICLSLESMGTKTRPRSHEDGASTPKDT
jgi:hypothetical protein